MRYARLVVALVLFAGTLADPAHPVAAERGVAFGDVPFGAGPDAVVTAMKALQFEPLARDEADDLFPLDQRFAGRVKGQDALVTAYYDPSGHLEKMLISFLTADEDCVPFYRTMKKELFEKYGKPMLDAEQWEFPYDKGGHVGQEHIALRVGKGLLASVWERDDSGSTEGGVTLRTADNVIVRLAYESSRWRGELTRRQKLVEDEPEPSSTSSAFTAAPDNRPRNASLRDSRLTNRRSH
jgi:hypothetical protein